jgi:hypothetical protein
LVGFLVVETVDELLIDSVALTVVDSFKFPAVD